MKKAKIIVELTSKQTDIFRGVHKYLSFINNLFESHIGHNFFIESIPNGLLYFYTDYEFYSAMIGDFCKEKVEKYLNHSHKRFSPRLIDLPDVDCDNFPSEGIEISFKIVKGDLEQILTPTIEHFQSFACEDSSAVEITKTDRKSLKIRFCTFSALENYLNDRASLIGGSIEKII